MQCYTCIHNNAFLQAAIGFCMLALVCNVWGYPTGAPAPACAKLGPIHKNATAQTSPSPYKIVVTSDTEGDLKWAAGSSLKGRLFHVQVTTFTVSSYIMQKYMNCIVLSHLNAWLVQVNGEVIINSQQILVANFVSISSFRTSTVVQ